MERRSFIKWAFFALNGLFAAVLGVPAVIFLLDPRNRPKPPGGFRTVAKLSDLEVNKPKEAVIRETRRDAWTLVPDDVVARVWLVRRPDENGQPKVECFNTKCPHLGCGINFTGTDFLCPCHGARFEENGKRIDPETNRAPRDMDRLAVELEPAGDDRLVKVEYRSAPANQA